MPPAPFQAFTVKFKGRADRVITPMGLMTAFDPAQPPPTPPLVVQTKALWDTGATKSSISPALAKELGLVPVGQVTVNHAGGNSISPTYLVNLRLPNEVGVAGVLVTEFPPGGGFDAIVGMDIIGLGDFSITNVGGISSMSFRMPSCVAIDYVAEANRLHFAGVGRNAPCPCGAKDDAGRSVKYKRCHGK